MGRYGQTKQINVYPRTPSIFGTVPSFYEFSMTYLLRKLIHHKKSIFLVSSFVFVVSGLNLIFPWSLKLIFDDILPARNFLRLQYLALFLIFVCLTKVFIEVIVEWKAHSIIEKVVLSIREEIYLHCLHLPLPFVEKKTVGEWLSRILSDTEAIKNFLYAALIDFFSSCLNIVLITTLLFILNVKLTFFALCFLPLYALLYYKLFSPFQKKLHPLKNEKCAGFLRRDKCRSSHSTLKRSALPKLLSKQDSE